MNTREIGTIFELYTIKNLFPKDNFELKFRSVDYQKGIFPTCNLNPDIHLKCLETDIEFWIECKFRRKLNYEYEIGEEQLKRYFNINKPIFYLFGFGENPKKPNKLSLIPLGRMRRFVDIQRIDNHLIKDTKIKNFNELLKITLSKK